MIPLTAVFERPMPYKLGYVREQVEWLEQLQAWLVAANKAGYTVVMPEQAQTLLVSIPTGGLSYKVVTTLETNDPRAATWFKLVFG